MGPQVTGAPGGDGRAGFALILVLLALLALLGIASAAVAATMAQVRAASVAGQVLAARAAARSELETVLASTVGAPAASVGGSAVELAADTFRSNGSWTVLDLRLSTEMHLLGGEAVTGGRVGYRHWRAVWWMDPDARVAAHRAVVEGASTAVAAGARIESTHLLGSRPDVPACSGRPALDGAFGGPGFPPTGPLSVSSDRAHRLGLLTWPTLVSLATVNLSSGSLPAGSCPSCWQGLVVGSGATEWTHAGRGVLVVDGDLALSTGAAWTGLVLAAGDAVLRDGAKVTGLLRAGGRVVLESGAEVDGSACAALSGITSASALRRPLALPGPHWAEPFAAGMR